MPNPPLNLPPNAMELEAGQNPHPGNCHACGQPLPDGVNQFSTGSRGNHPSLRIRTREVDSPLDPDGQLAYSVKVRLREGHSHLKIAEDLGITEEQAEGVERA
jgi:hypothetical protein